MRISNLLRGLLVVFAAISPFVLHAQFQPPNPDELKMTSDPKAPGADAVYLDFEENDSDARQSHNYYARIKVLTEKGKEAATVEIPYYGGAYSIGSVSGRTIHPDGTIVPLNVKPEDLLVVKTDEARLQKKVFTMPSVEVGSVLEFTYQLRENAQFYWHFARDWDVQQKYFIHKAHFFFEPWQDAYMIYWPHLPPGAPVKVDVAGRFTLDITDVPPLPDEGWMPPIESLRYRVLFYFGRVSSADEFWSAQAKVWSKDIDHFAEPTKTLNDAVAGLVSPSDGDLVKAQKLYAAVEALDNTDYTRRKSESERHELKLKAVKRAEDTWTQKSGNSNEIALLYLSMLRAAGLTAYATTVVDRKHAIFDPSYLSLDQLNITLVILSTGGKEILLDPGEKMCPFGTVNWRHSGAEGLRQSAGGPGRAETPLQTFGSNTIKRTGEIAIDPHGAITGTLQIVMTGQEALLWRQWALEVDPVEVKKQFDSSLEEIVPQGVEAHVDHFLGLDQPDSLLMAVVKVSGTPGAGTAKRLILPGFFFETREHEPFVNQERRLEPVDMQFASQVSDQLIYNLPQGAAVEGAPQDAKVSWENHAIYIVKSKSDPGQITIARVLARAFTLAKPEEYEDLRGFYQKVAAADQGQLVLAVAAPPKPK